MPPARVPSRSAVSGYAYKRIPGASSTQASSLNKTPYLPDPKSKTAPGSTLTSFNLPGSPRKSIEPDEAGITPAPSFNATNLLRDRYLFAFQSPLKRMEKPGYNCGSKHRRMGSLFTATTTASPPQSMIVQPVRLGMPPPDQVFIGD